MILNTPASLVLSITLALVGGSFALAQAPPAAVRFEQIEEVLSGYQESQHLYVQGEIGVSPEQLAALEAWLDTHGPHWTVVLMQRGADQRYAAPDGRAFTGMDAVEFALGHGLANRTQFGRLEHPKTGETDGAAFVLFLEDRKFSYYASDAQDRRGIGEAQWIGNLDRNARVAMQNGGRIIDAVKDTVNDINGRLAQSIANEEQAERERMAQAERVQRERQRAVAQVRADLNEIRSKLVPEVERLAGEFFKSFPEANGSLMARPPISEWTSELDKAESGLTEDNSRETSQAVASIIATIHRQLEYYGAHTAFEQTIAPLQQRWQGLTLHRYSAAAESHAQTAQQLLRRARSEHLSGNPAFMATVNEIRRALDQGDGAINAAIKKAEQDIVRRRIIRRTILVTLGIVFVATASLLLFLHRRRRASMDAINNLLADSQKPFHKERQMMAEVWDRKKAILGTLEAFAKRGKTGETLQLAQGVETSYGATESMLNSVEQHLSKIEGLINPTDLWTRVINLFSPTRYLEGRNLLVSKAFPVTSPNIDGSNGAVDPALQSMTLDDFMVEIAKKRAETQEKLNRLESSTRSAGPSVDNLAEKFVALEQQTRAIASEARSDGYFKLLALEDSLLPSIRRLIDRGRKMTEIDPVYVMESLSPEATRQMTDARDGIAFVSDVRSKHFPVFDEIGDKLNSLSHRSQWIEEHVIAIGERLNQLIQDASDREIQGPLDQLRNDAGAFLVKLQGILQIAGFTIQERLKEVGEVREALASARATVAKSLAVPISQCLFEESLNPDEHLQSAESAIKAARVAVDLGNLDGAMRATKAAEEETKYSQSLVEDSLQSLTEFPAEHARRRAEWEAAVAAFERIQKVVETAEQTYAPTALVWHDGSEDAHEADDSQDDLEVSESIPYAAGEPIGMQVESAKRILEAVRLGLDSAPAKHAESKLLEAANSLRFAAEGVAEANKRLQVADKHCKRIDALVPTNIRRSEMLWEELRKLNVLVEDARTESSTQEVFESLKGNLQRLVEELKERRIGRDPFEDANRLIAQRIALVEFRALLKADFAAFEEARLAVEGARRELKAVATLAMQSIEDQVPDSAEIARCQNEIRRLNPIVSSTEEDLKVAHNDWQGIQQVASNATAELGLVSGSLSQELRAAQEAASGIRTAANEVLKASRWTGAYGITVSGQPGSEELEAARNALAQGNYAETISLSGMSVSAATEAVEAAEEAVRSRRRQIEIAAARRRSREESLFSASSGASFGSSRSSWSSRSSSGSSFSSSSSSSSSRSSGGSSGFSRSGW